MTTRSCTRYHRRPRAKSNHAGSPAPLFVGLVNAVLIEFLIVAVVCILWVAIFLIVYAVVKS
jgi:hypothetical protein